MDGGAAHERTGLLRACGRWTNYPHVTSGLGSEKEWVKYPALLWHIVWHFLRHILWPITKMTLLSSPLNILLVCVPIGIIAGHGGCSPIAVFIINSFSIIGLAGVQPFATEEISQKLSGSLGEVFRAISGNIVELIVGITALQNGQFQVIKSSMIGSIMFNDLLVMGVCFFLGSIFNMRDDNDNGTEQSFASVTAQTTSSLMAVSAASMILPGFLFKIINRADDKESTTRTILQLSRGTAIVLLLLYVMYLVFQLKTHHNLFSVEPATTLSAQNVPDEENRNANRHQDDDDAEGVQEHMSPWSAGVVLILTTFLVSVCTYYLIDSINPVVASFHISRNFIGLILIPMLYIKTKHFTAVVMAFEDKMNLAVGAATGSSIRIALLDTPLLVILGWIMNKDMDLHHETRDPHCRLALTTFIVIFTVIDGKSNWLEGVMVRIVLHVFRTRKVCHALTH
ncbi:Sodium/calcium exchanger protein-domain-containing protein [Microdochium trichocladiopsis]|uniref:Vacuolar calcium ion transporter n=1 Tax=Microdochium trichocladiopsis TaxID=1682393 RepID=A0A9P9BMK0_9PEZI|nr:Sodium/calcium exchanger protein-domain-containing protein [Microdochium trichocladiopsis]KAH7029693.1 Sodium/calcium exchanger protein-domain-containing protein [Microdochium trichocladiopsis]